MPEYESKICFDPLHTYLVFADVRCLQDFQPVPGTYDLIWIQWYSRDLITFISIVVIFNLIRVIGHLHDLDFIRFFQNCGRGLSEHGVIVLKDNCCNSDDWTFVVDRNDSSMSRLVINMCGLFTSVAIYLRVCDYPCMLIFSVLPHRNSNCLSDGCTLLYF
jgi:hypothetical protein